MSDNQTYRDTHLSYLMKELDNVRTLLRFYADPDHLLLPEPELNLPTSGDLPTPLEKLTKALDLTPFEGLLLLLGIGVEIDLEIPGLCAQVLYGEGEGQSKPTIGLACQLLNQFSIQTLSLQLPIHQWQLVTLDLHHPLLQAPVTLTPWTIQYLLGFDYQDPWFSGSLKPRKLDLDLSCIPTAYQQLCELLLLSWSDFKTLPITQLIGQDTYAQQLIATVLYNQRGYIPYLIHAQDILIDVERISDWIIYWQRQAILDKLALVIDCGDPATLPFSVQQLIRELLQSCQTPIMLVGIERYPGSIDFVTYDLPHLSPHDQETLWKFYLGEWVSWLDGQIRGVVSHFNLTASQIQMIAAQTKTQVNAQIKRGQLTLRPEIATLLWKLCQVQSRSRLGGWVERIEPKAIWNDLNFHPDTDQVLDLITATLVQQAQVYKEWKMGDHTQRTRGFTALFYGPSDTEKLLAAEIIAHDLFIDLYRVDLSEVFCSSPAETEKNLDKIFEVVSTSGAVLLFDATEIVLDRGFEARDAGDGSAEAALGYFGYLLQHMAEYAGLAILSIDSPHALDTVCMRRIQFSVQFTHPNPCQRLQIWQDCFPVTTPTADLSYACLAQLEVSRASIRNIALGAAFLAAKAEEAIEMHHIRQAARAEFQKLGRSLTDLDLQDWVED
jgi:hypothetical protein